MLRSGTVVRLEVETVTPAPHRYTIERVVPDLPVVRDASGTATSQRPEDVAGSVEIFGQHELAELASSPERVAEMLRRFAGGTGEDPRCQEVREKLAENRKQLERAEKLLSDLQAELAEIPRLEEQVAQYKATDIATRLEDLQRLNKEESVFTEGEVRISSVADFLQGLGDPQIVADLTANFEGVEDSPREEILGRVFTATSKLADQLTTLAREAGKAVTEVETTIREAKVAWDAEVTDQRTAHAEVLRKLHDEGLDPDKYLDTNKALDGLVAKQPRLTGQKKTIETLQKERDLLLDQLGSQEEKQVEALHEAVRAANDATGGVVVVQPIASPDRSKIWQVITKHTSGARTQIMAAVNDDNFSPRSFVKAVRSGDDELSKLGIKGAQAATVKAAGESLLRELEELSVGHAVEVLLDVSLVKGTRELRKMDSLSKGQRATALLLLLLGASTAPLVIDQPEDDLDNRFVYDGVVANLKKLKGVRQIIASTHNANVPVLGDAELIVALEGDGQHGKPVKNGIGSLDDVAIRGLVENILEGGPAAFNARQHLYGF